MKPGKRPTQYQYESLRTLSPEELTELVNRAKFTPEQRKALLKRLGEIEKDPQSSPAELKSAEVIREAVQVEAQVHVHDACRWSFATVLHAPVAHPSA